MSSMFDFTVFIKKMYMYSLLKVCDFRYSMSREKPKERTAEGPNKERGANSVQKLCFEMCKFYGKLSSVAFNDMKVSF